MGVWTLKVDVMRPSGLFSQAWVPLTPGASQLRAPQDLGAGHRTKLLTISRC